MAFLQQNRRKYIRVKLSDASFKYVLISKVNIGRIADCAFLAAEMNPSWGHCQEEVAGKLICVNWVESGFDAECLNMANRFGTVDVSWMQINSCNWQGTGNSWDIFCHERGLDSKRLTMLWDLKTNMMFAAWLNERFIRGGKRTYSYGKKPIDLILYERLMEIVIPPETRTEI